MDMEELMDLLVKDESPSQISDASIKDQLFARSAEKIQSIRPEVAASIFDDGIDFDASSEEPAEFESNVDLDTDTEIE